MNKRVKEIIELVRKNPVDFKRFSNDEQQINPEARVTSIANILGKIDLPAHSTILDIGTGYGYGAVLLNALGYNVLGIEVNEEKINEGMKYWDRLGLDFTEVSTLSTALNLDGKLSFAKMDAKNLGEFPNSSVDMATAFYISGYMLGKKGPFSDVARVLKPNGKFAMTTEGPTQLFPFMRGPVFKLASRLFKPEGLQLSSESVISQPEVYDRFVTVYSK
jgi:SAM-dependent methyltransferase